MAEVQSTIAKVAQAIYDAPATLPERLPQLDTDDLVAAFKQLVDKYWWIDPEISDQYADLIIQTGYLTEEDHIVALGTMAKGDSQRLLGNTAQAWQLLNDAARLFQEAGDRYGRARTCIGRLSLAVDMDEVSATLAAADEAEAVFRERDDLHMVIRLLVNRAVVHELLGEHPRSLEKLQQAEDAALQLGAEGEMYLGAIYINMSTAYIYTGDLVAARQSYQRVQQHFQNREEPNGVAMAQVNLAHVERLEGNYREALRLLHAAQPNLAGRIEHTHSLIDMAQCYLALNRYDEALDISRNALTRCEENQLAHDEARTLCFIAIAQSHLGNPQAALTALDRAEAFYHHMQADGWMGMVHLQRSRVALQLDRADFAREEALRAIDYFQKTGRHVNETDAHIQHSRALYALGDIAAADEVAQAGLATAQAQHLPEMIYSARTILGKVTEASGQTACARDHYRIALDTIDEMQRQLVITLRTDYMTDKSEATLALIRLALDAGDLDEAFLTLERAKSQMLADYLVNRETLHWQTGDQADTALHDELAALRSRHHMLYHLLYEPRSDDALPLEMNTDETIAEIKQLEDHIQDLIERLYLNTSQPPVPGTTDRPSLADLQQQLAPDTCLIEYFHDGRSWLAFLLTADDLHIYTLPLSLDVTQELIEEHAFNIDHALAFGSDNAGSLIPMQQHLMTLLYEGLLAPLDEHLRAYSRLIIVPYSVLHYLPFNLLYDGEQYLIESCELTIYPQAGLLMQEAPQRSGGMRLLAHSLDGSLPGVLREADMLMDVIPVDRYQEAEATQNRLNLPPVQVLHLGTHGKHRLDHPELSYIRLANSQLYTDDLLQHDLSYELVTLSACETGRARVGGNDELIGLGRGFLIAGAGAVLASLWRVDDTCTMHFMQHFYRQLARGHSKTRALHDAQQALRRTFPDLHPAFWGAFQIVGDASPLSGLPPADD